MADQNQPITLKDRIIGVVVALGLLALGVFMFLNPDQNPLGDAHGRNALLKTVIGLIWSRPGGVVVALIGLLCLAGSFMKGGGSKADAPK